MLQLELVLGWDLFESPKLYGNIHRDKERWRIHFNLKSELSTDRCKQRLCLLWTHKIINTHPLLLMSVCPCLQVRDSKCLFEMNESPLGMFLSDQWRLQLIQPCVQVIFSESEVWISNFWPQSYLLSLSPEGLMIDGSLWRDRNNSELFKMDWDGSPNWQIHSVHLLHPLTFVSFKRFTSR